MARRRRPRQAGEGTTCRIDKVFDVLAHRLRVAERVVLCQEAVKERLLRRAAHLAKFERPKRAQRNRQRRRIDGDGLCLPSSTPVAGRRVEAPLSRGRQLKVSGALKAQQQPPADHVARRSVGLLPLPRLAQ